MNSSQTAAHISVMPEQVKVRERKDVVYIKTIK